MTRVFGYGSLVNRGTHDFTGDMVTLSGWRRTWVTTAARPAAFLSVEPADEVIDGFAFTVPDDGWTELNRREAEYDLCQTTGGLSVYAVPERNMTPGAAPILRSYLDTVLQGFLAELGEDALPRFMATTASWRRGIYDDRADPIYPRHTAISAQERAMFDALLTSVPVVGELV